MTPADVKLTEITKRLRAAYAEAKALQLETELNSTGWWYCEGQKLTAEIALRTIGYEP